VSFEERKDGSLFVVEVATNDGAEFVGSGGDIDPTGQRGVEGRDRRWDGAVFLDHRVDLASVIGIDQMGPQHGPQIVVLGGVVPLQRVAKCGPSGPDGLGHPKPFDVRCERFQTGQVATDAAWIARMNPRSIRPFSWDHTGRLVAHGTQLAGIHLG